MLRTLAAAALATSVVAVAAPAQAQDDGRPMGLRFELGWAGHQNIASFGVADDAAVTAPISPNGDIKVGYDLGQFTPLIGLSFINTSRDVTEDDSASITAFVLDLEARYYLKPHRKGLQPFVFGEFNTAFVSLSDDRLEGEAEDALDDIASLLDYTEINAGLGMEYKFDQQGFAIGGKWGLGLAFQGFDVGDEDFGVTSIGTIGAIYAAWRI